MALNPLSEYVSGVKSLALKLFAKKSDGFYEAIKTNDNGAMKVSNGSNLVEIKDQTDAVEGVVTFTENISTIGIYNTDEVNDGIFIVNGISIPVPAGVSFKDPIGGTPGATVAVSGATTYIASRYI